MYSGQEANTTRGEAKCYIILSCVINPMVHVIFMVTMHTTMPTHGIKAAARIREREQCFVVFH